MSNTAWWYCLPVALIANVDDVANRLHWFVYCMFQGIDWLLKFLFLLKKWKPLPCWRSFWTSLSYDICTILRSGIIFSTKSWSSSYYTKLKSSQTMLQSFSKRLLERKEKGSIYKSCLVILECSHLLHYGGLVRITDSNSDFSVLILVYYLSVSSVCLILKYCTDTTPLLYFDVAYFHFLGIL